MKTQFDFGELSGHDYLADFGSEEVCTSLLGFGNPVIESRSAIKGPYVCLLKVKL